MTTPPNPPFETQSLAELHKELGIPSDYGSRPLKPRFQEAAELAEAGPNLLGRMQRLKPEALVAWHELARAAASDGHTLLLVSGFRAIDYQADIIRNKLKSGQTIEEILNVSAAPGYSEHHTGCAVDIAAPGSRPLTAEFEQSPAYDWLQKNAKKHGFTMTYPRDNPFGFEFEPWHWRFGAR